MTAVVLLCAVSVFASIAVAGLGLWVYLLRRDVTNLVAITEQQRATLTAVPPTAPQLRAEAEAFRARNVARVVESAIHHGRRAAA